MRINNSEGPEHKSDDVMVCPSRASIPPDLVDQGLEPVVRLRWLQVLTSLFFISLTYPMESPTSK